MSHSGPFSEAGLHEWMPFVIFHARSRKRLQHHFWADFWVGVASCCLFLCMRSKTTALLPSAPPPHPPCPSPFYHPHPPPKNKKWSLIMPTGLCMLKIPQQQHNPILATFCKSSTTMKEVLINWPGFPWVKSPPPFPPFFFFLFIWGKYLNKNMYKNVHGNLRVGCVAWKYMYILFFGGKKWSCLAAVRTQAKHSQRLDDCFTYGSGLVRTLKLATTHLLKWSEYFF